MDTFSIIVIVSLLVVAAVSDLRFQKIHNYLTYPAMVIALAFHALTNGLDGLLFSAEGLALGIAILIVPYLMGGMGAGDCKLMGAVGAILGPRGLFIVFLLTAIVGGVYVLIMLVIRRQYFKGLLIRQATTLKTFVFTGHFIPIPATQDDKKPRLCYGIAVALGTLLYISLELAGYKL